MPATFRHVHCGSSIEDAKVFFQELKSKVAQLSGIEFILREMSSETRGEKIIDGHT